MDVAAALRISIGRICEVPVESITDATTLEDLGIDSLTAAEVLTDVEIHVGRDLPVDGLRRLTASRTVGDVVTLLEDELGRPVG
jgi:acyl carrier protein